MSSHAERLTPVPGTNRRIGVDHVGTHDFFWLTNRQGMRIGNRLGVIQARPFADDFHLALEAGELRGKTHTSVSYEVLLGILLLAYDQK